MPLSKLQNFIKNTEGKLLYVNPNDIGATDSIENQGNSLSQPFKTLQRALIEAARFSYVRGNSNDLFDRTTILLFPGEHVVDNRPGFKIKNDNGTAKAVSPSGVETLAQSTLTLSVESVFDLGVEDNMLYKFNSVNGGCILPRGTAIVGLDLRKTKIRPLYVPNPTDDAVPASDLIRLTGTCYFRDFTFFDGALDSTVYTDSEDFSPSNRSKPTFSHHKLTCFGYADGVNEVDGTGLTDLDMYYSKLSNAFNEASGRNIDQKYPQLPGGFEKSRIEWEIVGAFAADPVEIKTIISGDGITPNTQITVTTEKEHGLTSGTPIKVTGVNPDDYNISTFVQDVPSSTKFTYLLPNVDPLLAATGTTSGAKVIIETDTVTGASPYIFNVSLRSVYGMNGMIANGKNASGFRSMVVAQFTAVSLQKDDRSFVKYNPVSRTYDGITLTKVTGSELASGSSSTNPNTVYHLDSNAIYRSGWETTHVKMSNDAIIQLVSVFAIGFNKHFMCESGGDASITNSNSNFGQIALVSDGFKKEAFAKDDLGYVTSIVAPKTVERKTRTFDWLGLDVGLTTSVGVSSHLYLNNFTDRDNPPNILIQGYRVGAKQDDELFVKIAGVDYSAPILITDNVVSTSSTIVSGQGSKERITPIGGLTEDGEFSTDPTPHNLVTGEKIRIFSEDGDLPENLEENTIYYAVVIDSITFEVASTESDALKGETIAVYGGTGLRVESRVSDKAANEIGCPVLYDPNHNNWFIHVEEDNAIYNKLLASDGGVAGIGPQTSETFIKRIADGRNLNDKIYKVRYFVPKEADLGRNPVEGFVLQDSSTTNVRTNQDFTLTGLDLDDYDYNRNVRYIATCSVSGSNVVVRCELPHELHVGDRVQIVDVKSTTNTTGAALSGYNGEFSITEINDDQTFTYGTSDVDGNSRQPGDFTSDMNTRVSLMPRFQKVNNQVNATIYRSQVIQKHIPNISDGIFHFLVLAADNKITEEFTGQNYLPKIENFYPQLDRDNLNENPPSAKSFAKRDPMGDIAVDDPESSITRETVDKIGRVIGVGRSVIAVERDDTSGITTVTLDRRHGLSGIVTYSSLSGGTGFTAGNYYNVKLINDGTSTWDGATAKITVGSGGAVIGAKIISPGSGYLDGEVLDIDGFSGASLTISNSGIASATDNAIQLTGVGKTDDGFYRITSIPEANKVAFAMTSGDPNVLLNQYLVNSGKSVAISTITKVGNVNTIVCNDAHGLISGSSLKIVDSSNNRVGEYNVLERVGINTFTISTTDDLQTNPFRVLPTTFAARGGNISDETESLGSRGVNLWDGDSGLLGNDLGSGKDDNKIVINLANSGISTTDRFPLGTYLEIDGEIMRIASAEFSGSLNNELTVIRGYLGSNTKTHQEGALVRRIKVFGTELRRPSILRASGHTFEYLGYGPGNYSTGLPQVQTITLTDREEFLTQSQNRSAGVVVYTAMNNDGDFFIGNKIINPSTGEETTFNAPIPSIRGEDPSVLSVIFDEVVVNDRLTVEGGASKTILSSFGGPVSIDNTLNVSGNTTLDGNLELGNDFSVSGNVNIDGNLNVTGVGTFTDQLDAKAGADFANIQIGVGSSTGVIKTATGDLTLESSSTNVVRVNDNMDVVGKLSATFLIVPNIPPIGGVMNYAGHSSKVPDNWKLADGAELDQATYPDLYNALTNDGTIFPFGNNPTATTFLLPNLSDKFVVGADTTYVMGAKGGSADAITVEHNHVVNSVAAADHSHGTSQVADHGHSIQAAADHSHNTSGGGGHSHTNNSGGGHAHNTNNTGNHAHNTNNTGNHKHNMNNNGNHGHQYQRANGSVERGNRNNQSATQNYNNRNTGGAGGHNHNMNNNGGHSHNTNNNGAHSHNTNNAGGHNHNTNTVADHSHNVVAGGGHSHGTVDAGGHNHTTNSEGAHNHGITPEAAGSSGTNANLPPYYALSYIIRVS